MAGGNVAVLGAGVGVAGGGGACLGKYYYDAI
jgi:hypothetical protein